MKGFISIILFLFCFKSNGQVAAWGDSMTEYPQGQSYTTWLSKLIGQYVLNGGIAGNTSTQIMNRYLEKPEAFDLPIIIWSGTNNYSQKATIIQDIQRQVDTAISHSADYIIVPIFNGTAELFGSVGYNKIISANDSMAIQFAGHYFKILDAMLNLPAITAQDSIDKTNKVICQTYRSDNLHLNVFGAYYFAKILVDSCASILLPIPNPIGNVRAVNNLSNSVFDGVSLGAYSPSGDEMIIGSLTGTNWVDLGNNSYQHTSGSTVPLTKSVGSILLNTRYQVEFEVAGATAGTLLVKLGNDTVKLFQSIPATGKYYGMVKSPSNGVLVLSFTPTNPNFNGTIVNPSVRMSKTDSEPQITIRNNSNNLLAQFRAYDKNSWGWGIGSGYLNKSNQFCIWYGDNVFTNLANSIGMTGIGYKIAPEAMNSTYSTFVGYQQNLVAKNFQYVASGGVNNLMVAAKPDFSAIWSVRGYEKLINGTGNAGIGYLIGQNMTGGNNNFFAGYLAGNNLTSGNSNVAIGYNAKFLSPTGNNQISISNYIFKGTGSNFTINATGTDSLAGGQDLSADFEVRGTKGTGWSRGTTTQMNAISNPSPGLMFVDLSLEKVAVYFNGWKYLQFEP